MRIVIGCSISIVADNRGGLTFIPARSSEGFIMMAKGQTPTDPFHVGWYAFICLHAKHYSFAAPTHWSLRLNTPFRVHPITWKKQQQAAEIASRKYYSAKENDNRQQRQYLWSRLDPEKPHLKKGLAFVPKGGYLPQGMKEILLFFHHLMCTDYLRTVETNTFWQRRSAIIHIHNQYLVD